MPLSSREVIFPLHPINNFFLSGCFSQTFTIHSTAGEGRSYLVLLCHFHPLHRHLGINQAITADSSPLHIVRSRTRNGNLWFPRASRLVLCYASWCFPVTHPCDILFHPFFGFDIIESPYPLKNELRFKSRNIRTVRYGIVAAAFVGSRMWSYMLSELKESTSLNAFRLKIKAWIPESCPCKLCKTYLQKIGYLQVTN